MNNSGFYLDFERDLVALQKQIDELKEQAKTNGLDLDEPVRKLEAQAAKKRREIYANLSPWQQVQISRHPHRPYALDYVERMLSDFTELHGDRLFADDASIIGGPAWLDDESVMVIGIQSGRNLEERQKRNFGMPHPEGYRKARRLMQMAAKFKLPVLTLVDTSGAYPGIEAEERGQAEAIARNLYEMSHLPVPIVVAIIGQAFSGGAIGITVGDRILMMEHACYSVIVPEVRERREEAAEALKLTAKDLQQQGIIDRIVPEPLGGAHHDWDNAASALKRCVQDALAELQRLDPEKLIAQRLDKFAAMARFEE
ncbi:MAG: acetyl-CoA carboxylase carboxyltransferase subunit alpha [Candidatus Latescibacteria bacterium]|nr:acetyl-CoA carboxylase carboxyltransferase subunit alpha [Candidatus Latescibacterota bacterium]